MKSLVENKYVFHCRKYVDSDYIRDIFLAHPYFIKLFRDSTYKYNKYCLSLLDFFGVTSTGLTFYIAFASIMYEKGDNVTWALEMCRDLLNSKDISPKVVVTDRDNALMNVVDIVF